MRESYKCEDVCVRGLHSSLAWCPSELCSRDELLTWSYPHDGAIVTLAAVGQLERGESTPGEGETKKLTVL